MSIRIIGAVVGVVAVGVVALTLSGDGGPRYEIGTAEVHAGPIAMSIETSGTVEPLQTIQVGCEVSGRIVEMAVDFDQPVRKGQVICRIDPELAQAEHNQSVADYLKAKSAMEDARLALAEQTTNLPVQTKQALARKQETEAELVNAEFDWNRVNKLYESRDASEAEWVATRARHLRAQSALTAAQAAYELAVNNEKILLDRGRQAVAQAEAALKLAEARKEFTATRVERCTITSPIDGVVLKRYMDVGNTVVASFQTPILYLLAPSLDRMRVVARVSESDISHVEVGQPAHFTVQARQAVEFHGRILERRNQPDVVQNVTTYTVVMEVENDERHTLLPGLSVNVIIECVSKKKVPRLANAALRFKPPISSEDRQALLGALRWPGQPSTDAAGQPALYCSKAVAWNYDEADGRWEAVPLWVGVTDNVTTEILAGAKVGDRFVKRCVDLSGGGFDFKEALKLARPDNRTL